MLKMILYFPSYKSELILNPKYIVEDGTERYRRWFITLDAHDSQSWSLSQVSQQEYKPMLKMFKFLFISLNNAESSNSVRYCDYEDMEMMPLF